MKNRKPCAPGSCTFLPATSYSEVYWGFGGKAQDMIVANKVEAFVCPSCGDTTPAIVWGPRYETTEWTTVSEYADNRLSGVWLHVKGAHPARITRDAIGLQAAWCSKSKKVCVDGLAMQPPIGLAENFDQALAMVTAWYHANNYGIQKE